MAPTFGSPPHHCATSCTSRLVLITDTCPKWQQIKAEVEVYAGALHRWCPPDSRVYNQEQAERAWSRLLALFEAALVNHNCL